MVPETAYSFTYIWLLIPETTWCFCILRGGSYQLKPANYCKSLKLESTNIAQHPNDISCIDVKLQVQKKRTEHRAVELLTFLMDGSSHSYQRALHCLADLRTRSEDMRAHWFLPYFMTAALRISSSVFFHTPPFIMILILSQPPARRPPSSFLCFSS
jgi:hypothetical protein